MPRRKKPTTIKEVRVSQNLSQAEFAKVIGVSTPSVSAYETGRVNLPKKVADKVFELYSISLPVPEQRKVKKTDAPKRDTAAPKKKDKLKTAITIQSPMGGEITIDEVLKKTGNVEKIYIRVDENKAYWVNGEETGSVDLW